MVISGIVQPDPETMREKSVGSICLYVGLRHRYRQTTSVIARRSVLVRELTC